MCFRKRRVTFMKLALVCIDVALAAQILGLLCPFWLHVKINALNASSTNDRLDVMKEYVRNGKTETSFISNATDALNIANGSSLIYISRYFGLWFVFTCLDSNCWYGDYPDWDDVKHEITDFYDHGFNFTRVDSRVPIARQKEYLVELILAVVILLFALLLVWHHKSLYQKDISGRITQRCHSYRHYTSLACVVISGVLSWIPFMGYGQANADFRNFLHQKRDFLNNSMTIMNHTLLGQTSVGIPFSLLFSGSGIVLAATAFLIIFLTMYLSSDGNIVRQTDAMSTHTSTRHNDVISLNMRHEDNMTNQIMVVPPNRGEDVDYLQHLHVSFDLSSDGDRAGNRMCECPPYTNLLNIAPYQSDTTVREDQPPSYEEAVGLHVKTES